MSQALRRLLEGWSEGVVLAQKSFDNDANHEGRIIERARRGYRSLTVKYPVKKATSVFRVLCLLSVIAVQGGSTVVHAASGLVAAYAFNEGSGSTTADASGQGNTGTISGATWTASGRFGGALSFNGTSSWVTVNDAASLHLTSGVTLEAWVKLTAVTGWQAAVIKEQPGGLAYSLYSNTDRNVPSGTIHTTSDVNLYGNLKVPVNTWTHLATTYDGATLRLYVNGAQVSSQAVAGQMPTSTSPLRMGGDSVWGEYLNGLIDEVRIYNRALSAAEIQTDINTPISVAPQTVQTVTPTSFTLTAAGATQQLTATAIYSDSSTQNVTNDPTTTYTSNNLAAATVSATGLVAAVANGTATITVSHGGFSATATATVNIPPPVQTGITVTPVNFTLTTAGATQQLTVTATYSNGTTQTVTTAAGTTYGSNNTAAATVSATGLVTAVANGTATITAAYGGFSGGATATVNTSAPTQTGLTVAPPTFTLASAGATRQLTVTATYSNGTTQTVTTVAGTTYGSNNTAAATVNATGLVTAVANGTATITASFGGFSASSTATVSVATTGLVAAYAFGEGSGSTTADASGQGNTGTISGATWTASGRFGGALSFNGTSSWVTVNDAASLHLTSGVTLEAWVKLTAVTGWQAAVIKEQPGGLAYGLYSNTDRNVPSGTIHTTSDVNLYGNLKVPVNTWTHLATTYDGATLRLYVNGAQVSSQAVAGQMPTSTSPLRMGGDSVWGEYLNGLIDEVRIYNRALSAAGDSNGHKYADIGGSADRSNRDAHKLYAHGSRCHAAVDSHGDLFG